MAKSIVKGDDLMLFYQGKSIAYATAHTLSVNADAVDTSSKDHGVWSGNEVNKISWEITSENLYTTEYDDLFDIMVARQPINVFFGTKSENDPDKTVANGDYSYWTPSATVDGYAGKVLVTALSVNANSGENATYSVTLTGTGKLVQKKYSAS